MGLREAFGIGSGGSVKNNMTKPRGYMREPAAGVVIAPHGQPLPPEFEKNSTKQNILLVHVDEDIVVLVAQAPHERVKAVYVGELPFALVLSERVDGDVGGQAVRARLEADDVHLLAVGCEFFYPPMEEAEDRVLGVDDLGDDEEFHGDAVKYDLSRLCRN